MFGYIRALSITYKFTYFNKISDDIDVCLCQLHFVLGVVPGKEINSVVVAGQLVIAQRNTR